MCTYNAISTCLLRDVCFNVPKDGNGVLCERDVGAGPTRRLLGR